MSYCPLLQQHPKYTFDQFLHAIDVISSTRSEPCGSIRRINVEIPSLSVSDMRRLKATDKVGAAAGGQGGGGSGPRTKKQAGKKRDWVGAEGGRLDLPTV